MQIQIVSDYVCPYCFWLEELLSRLKERPEVVHVPYQLTEPPEPRPDVWNDPERRARYAGTLGPACQRMGVRMCLPPRVTPRPYTDLTFQGLYFAREQGREEAYHSRVFRAYFQEERDIGDIGVLTELAEEAGLEPEAFRQALERGIWAERFRREIRQVKETLDIRVVPTLLAGGERLEGFIPDLETLENWLRQIREKADG